MKKLLFVYNPHSGKGAIGKYLSGIIEILTGAGFDVTVHPTCAARDGENYIIKNADGYDLIVSSGGDGMLHELVNAATALGKGHYGYIPSGTINDYASSLGIPKDIPAAAEVIAKENFVKIDAGRFGDRVFSYVAAFGIFTDVSYSTDQKVKNALGPLAYFLNALKELDLNRFHELSTYLTVEFNGEKHEGEFILGLCGNTFSVGGMKNIIPAGADMRDGLLEGIFVKTPKTLADLDLLRRSLTGDDLDDPNIICVKSDKFTVISEKELAWTLDGEDGGKTTRAEISVIPKAYEIASPTGF